MTTPLLALTEARLTELLDRMTTVRTAIVGDLMLDRYLLGDVERISPEAPVPVVTVESEWDAPGGAANVAANVAALGSTVMLVGVIGDDDAGEILRQALIGHDIDCAAVIEALGRPTTTKTRILARGQQVVRIDREVTNPLPDRIRDALLAAAHRAIAAADVLLLEDYDKGALDDGVIGDLIRAATNRGIPIVADPKERHFFAFSGASVLKPNRRELDTAFKGQLGTEPRDLIDARARLNVDNLLLTVGAEGLLLVSEDGSVHHSPSIARTVYDVSGAGDTITSWIGVALAAGATTAEAAWLANLAAGVQVGKQGTATVSRNELLDAWDDLAGE
ncbi:MAG: PfkB family carbohydrate kinase [Gemmatimonadota bacterium]